jgi:hypothetical protein
MKKWIIMLICSFSLLSCSKGSRANLPDDLGEFKLGVPMSSIVTMLNAKGLNEVNLEEDVWVGEDKFPEYSYDVREDTHGSMIGIHFSSSSPYVYEGKKWEWVILEFFQREVYGIELCTYYEGMNGIEESFNIYRDEAQRLQSCYKMFEKETNKGNDYANVTYEYGNKRLYLVVAEDEGLTSFLTLVLRDFEIENKVFGE